MIHLTLASMAYGGEAVGRHQGKAIFVPYGIPGEVVEAEITEDRGRHARARLVAVASASPHRVEPRCPHFGPGRCGGCHWQHIAYPAQLAFKAAVLRDQLVHLGKIAAPQVAPAQGLEDPWRYRNNVQLVPDGAGHLGFQAAGSNRVVPISRCPIMYPSLVAMLWGDGPRRKEENLASLHDLCGPVAPGSAAVRRVTLRAGVNTGERMMVLEVTGPAASAIPGKRPFSLVATWDGKQRTLAGRGYLEERLGGRTFRVSAMSFFQVNTLQAERLVGLVERYAQLQGDETLLDCFCGVGTFGILLAGRAKRVIGVEAAPSAVADARYNAAHLANVTILPGHAESVLPALTERVQVALLDPPREGCQMPALQALATLAPRRIVYVSCEPSTLARDVRRLAEMGYSLIEATPVDMFPQTYHVETVVLMSRVKE